MDVSVSDPRQKLRLSPGFRSAFALLMLVGVCIDAVRVSDPPPWKAWDPKSNSIRRIAGRPLKLERLGIEITPTDGWTCLQAIGGERKKQLAFVNPQRHLVVTLDAVRFHQWPPKWTDQDAAAYSPEIRVSSDHLSGGSEVFDVNQSVTDLVQSPRIFRQLETQNCGEQIVQWFQRIDEGHSVHQYGRIDTGRQELLIDVATPARLKRNELEMAIGQLCRTIRSLH